MDKRLLKELRPIRVHLVALAVCAAILGILIVAQAAAITILINGAFLEQRDVTQMMGILVAALAVIAGRSLLAWGSALIAGRAAAIVKTSLRTRLVAQFQALGPHYLAGERSGELAVTLVEGVESLDAFASQLAPQLCIAVLVPLLIGMVVCMVDLLSGLIFLLTTPVLLLFMYLIGTLASAHTKKQWSQLSRMSAHFLDVLQGLTTLKLFGRSQIQRENIARISDLFRETTMGVLRVAFLSSLVLELGATLSTALVAVETGLRLLYGQIAFAPAFFVLLLAPDFYLPLRTLGAKFHASMPGSAAVQRIYKILNIPIASIASPSVVSTSHAHPITFSHISYTYHDEHGDDRPALRDISLVIEPGQRIALVGASGAGKSTLASLLLRFIEPQAGEILIGDVPLSALPVREWREQIAWIAQRPYLFNTTLAENIRIGRSTASMEEVVEAARRAHIHDFIVSLPQGYDTLIGEQGVRLSGGQRQRLAIARALLKNAPILLLDEATAHLDEVSEQVILEELQRQMHQRIALIIAHRLRTVREVDKVIVLHGGQIVGAGTHEQLLAQSRAYRELVNAYESRMVV